jgi:hypothetical protein
VNFYGYLGRTGLIYRAQQLLKKEQYMKQILLAVLMVFMFQVMAIADDGEDGDKGEGKGKNFETRKAKALENIAKRRSFLSELESCIGSASSREDMKSCRQKHKQSMKALHPEGKRMKEKHEKRKDKKRKRERH